LYAPCGVSITETIEGFELRVLADRNPVRREQSVTPWMRPEIRCRYHEYRSLPPGGLGMKISMWRDDDPINAPDSWEVEAYQRENTDPQDLQICNLRHRSYRRRMEGRGSSMR
jgi:hypothetical protein